MAARWGVGQKKKGAVLSIPRIELLNAVPQHVDHGWKRRVFTTEVYPPLAGTEADKPLW
jgi:hypothetical protein